MKKAKNIFTSIALLIAIAAMGYLSFAKLTSAQTDDGASASKTSQNKLDFTDPRELNSEVRTLEVNPADIPRKRNHSGAQAIVPAVGTDLGNETEPNDTFMTADPLTSDSKIRGNVFGNGDLDWFSFTANTGDRVYAAVQTSYSNSGSTDSQLRVFASNGTTELEFDEDDGSLGGLSSSIAGTVIPSNGTYYLQVKHFSATTTLRPYELYLKVQSGAPTPEVEANDAPGTANPLPASGWVSGARNPAVATEQDWFSFTANAGDTVFLSLDLDPERDVVTWNGRLGIALFGDANNQILVVDDAGTFDTIDSEAMFMTVKNAGTYYAFVDSATAATGGPTATYNLSVTRIPKTNVGINCTTYTSTNVPQVIGPGVGLVSSTITVPPTMARIASTKVSIVADHALMADMDVNLRSPANNDNGLFNDIGSTATGGQTMMDITLDQYSSGVPFVFTVVRPLVLKPELNYRLDWFDGENPSGVWTLDIRDDLTNTSGGNLTGWSLEICSQPAPAGALVYSEDFEMNNGGYTHSGTADEWEYGTPSTAATTTVNPVASIIGCNSGTMCWKTDLDNTYELSSNQDLVSPSIILGAGSLNLSWAMRYQFESATFDHAFVEVREVGGMGAIQRVWEWTGATMTVGVGSPTVNIGESAGWGNYRADISAFANKTVQIVFHLDTDTSINFAGVAIDDVQIRSVPTVPVDAPVDFNGDGKTDYAVARNVGLGSSGATNQLRWFYNLNGGGPTVAIDWGIATDTLIPEDFDGDGKDDIAVWRPGAATVAAFYILRSATNTARVEAFGQTGDDPTVVNDYDGDGKADVAVYRSAAQSTWFYRGSLANPGGNVTYVPWGKTGDFVAPGDYDGDGKNDFVIQRDNGGGTAAFWMLKSGGGTSITLFGTPTDVIVPGDYDGDGKTDIATVIALAGAIEWRWLPSGGGAIQFRTFGVSATDIPVQGDYDGDGRTDIAIWRPSGGQFWSQASLGGAVSVFALGTTGDVPAASYNTHYTH